MRKVIYLLPVLLLLGCGARKKDLHETKSDFKYNAETDTTAKINSSLETTGVTNEKLHEWFLNSSFRYQGKPGDSASVKQYDGNGKLMGETKFTGSGSIDVDKQESTKEKEVKHTETAKATTSTEAIGSTKVTAAGSTKDKGLKVEREAVNFIKWIWVVVGFIIMIILIVLDHYKVFSRLKNHVLNKFSGRDTFASNKSDHEN